MSAASEQHVNQFTFVVAQAYYLVISNINKENFMKQFYENPVTVSFELNVIEDVIKIIGSAIHSKFSHDEVSNVLNFLKKRGQEAFDANRKAQDQLPEEAYGLG